VPLGARGRVFLRPARTLKYARSLLSDPDTARPTQQAEFLRRVGRTLDRIEAFPKPVIAAVQGLTLAGRAGARPLAPTW